MIGGPDGHVPLGHLEFLFRNLTSTFSRRPLRYAINLLNDFGSAYFFHYTEHPLSEACTRTVGGLGVPGFDPDNGVSCG